MKLTVLGAAGSYPTAVEPGSGFLLEADGARIVLDLGPGTLPRLLDEVPIHAVDAVVVTHGHADHSADLLAWYHLARHGIPPRSSVPLLAPTDVVDRVGAFLKKGAEELGMVFDHRPAGPGSTETVAGVSLTFGAVVHPVPAIAVRVDAAGKSMVYTGDTAPSADVVELAGGCDLLVCEATLVDETVPGIHCSAEDAGAMARDAGVGALLLTHLRPDQDSDAAIEAANREFEGPVGVAKAGLTRSI